MGTTVGMSALCQQLTLSACPDLLSNLLDVRQLPHLVEERLGWGVGAEHDFEATFGIGRRPLSARSGQMHRSKQRHYDHWGRVRSLGACRRFLIFIPSDEDCDDRRAD